MPVYSYTAYNSKGKQVEGKHEADNINEVADFLHKQSLTIIDIREDISFALKQLANIQIGDVPVKEKMIIAKQLSIMLEAGVPIVPALRVLAEQAESVYLQQALKEVYASVEAGSKLSEALRGAKQIFSPVQINLIEAGEQSGNLNEIMIRISIDLEKSQQLQSRIRSAMVYPVIVFVLLIVVMLVVVVFMVPSVQDLYSQVGQGAELPAVTQVLVEISNFLTNPIGLITFILVLLSIFIGFRYFYTTQSGRKTVDRLLLKMPIFGNLLNLIELSQFTRILSMMLASGVPIVKALQIVADAQGNMTYREIVAETAEGVTRGLPMSLPLAKDQVFPGLLLKVIATGEDTGNIDKVLSDMARFYDAEVDEITNGLSKLMEPLILVITGGVVAFIAVAVYFPMYDLGSVI